MGQRAPTNQAIQGLWISGSLSIMERLSITSFLAQGHEYHLYIYDDVQGIPAGATVKDASEILPRSAIFRHVATGSYGVFSDVFRYKMLWDRGGWWADLDVVAVKPFDVDVEHVFATERDEFGRECLTNCVIKAPPRSEIIQSAWADCQDKDLANMAWGVSGPNLMHRLLFRSSFHSRIVGADTFCPVDPDWWFQSVIPLKSSPLRDTTLGVHLLNDKWRHHGLDKNEQYAPGSLYEQLKRRYLT